MANPEIRNQGSQNGALKLDSFFTLGGLQKNLIYDKNQIIMAHLSSGIICNYCMLYYQDLALFHQAFWTILRTNFRKQSSNLIHNTKNAFT